MFSSFCYDLQSAAFALSLPSGSFQPFYPKPALHFVVKSMFPPPLTVSPCLPQDTAEYVAYVAKDPVNQRGEKEQQNDTFTQAASGKNTHVILHPKVIRLRRTLTELLQYTFKCSLHIVICESLVGDTDVEIAFSAITVNSHCIKI